MQRFNDASKIYHSEGRAWLVCPRLLELDSRHGQHPDKAPACRKGGLCPLEHEHETLLVDPEGHTCCLFWWPAGSSPPLNNHPLLICGCGRPLVHADLDDPWDSAHVVPAE